ncbi:type II toxin-antitoxin system VapC family toxin [Marinobacter bryozoorum]|uniref:type II toxin-antitoxin system VapC family toxin n=1 Tax=Marinobacter bryozoorum TaxID=256324 RepID=UPI0020053E64|nr:type II toxin-antitoxin system VapC family toxin [Marinobacter bryozoorum]MCK7542782.1 type II toxin-antitoxin system VapC family toxin [Marinobacter bryozoorum]
MLVDTDVLIWAFRGNDKAADYLDRQPGFSISIVTYMELIQGARNRTEMQLIRKTLRYWSAQIEQVNETISSRAAFLVEEYALSHNMELADALIASSALSIGDTLMTSNDKHYRFIPGLEVNIFRP